MTLHRSLEASVGALHSGNSSTFLSTNVGYFADHLTLSECLVSVLHEELRTVNFSQPIAAAKIINDDVSNATRNQIQNFVRPNLLARTEFLLLNAVYFQGFWERQFLESRTVNGTFQTSNSEVQTVVPMMVSDGLYRYGE